MSKFNMAGLVFLVSGAVIVIFQAVASMKTAGDIIWEPQTLVTTFGEDAFLWIEDISVASIQNIVQTLIHQQMFTLLFSLGAVCIILGMITKK